MSAGYFALLVVAKSNERHRILGLSGVCRGLTMGVQMPSERERGYHEGPDAAKRMTGLMGRVLSVSKDELARREAAYQKSRKAKKSRRVKKSAP